MPTWDVHPRNPDLTRTLDDVRFDSLTLVERFNQPDSWVLKGSAAGMAALTAPGMGVILDRDGVQVTSGQAGVPRRFVEDGREVIEVGFQSDLAELGGRTVLPNPAKVLTSTPSTIGAVHDRRVGPRETLIVQYVAANLGASSLTSRRATDLILPTSLGRGGSTTVEARLDNLGVLVQTLAEAGGLRVTVEHDESTGVPRLALRITPVLDVSADVRFGPASSTALGIVTGFDVDWEKPTCTAAIVVAGDEGADRQALMVVNDDLELLWGGGGGRRRRWEQVIDQRQTVDPVVMLDAAQKALDEGAGFVNIRLDVADGPDVQVRRDYSVGYRVGTDLPGLPDAIADNVVRELKTTVTGGEASEVVSIVVGTPGASSQQTKAARLTTEALRRVNLIERSA